MNIIIAMDSFKGCLSASEAGAAAAEGIRSVMPSAHITVLPLADGGEGTVSAIYHTCGGQIRTIRVHDPLGREIFADYLILPDGTAVIEAAAAAGLTLLSPSERNPMYASSRGFGEQILHALQDGCRRFILGLGGSATNDGGIGCMQALGFSFTDGNGNEVTDGAAGLAQVAAISSEYAVSQLSLCTFETASDVRNPLCGENGCSAVFSPQKGADAETAARMDQAMERYAEIVKARFPEADPDAPGAGAAGGLGFALTAFLRAHTSSGIGQVLGLMHVQDLLAEADLVLTGEGKTDMQTAMGKAPAGIAEMARQAGVPVIALCGAADVPPEFFQQCAIDAVFPAVRGPISAEAAIQPAQAKRNLAETAAQIIRLILAVRNHSQQ